MAIPESESTALATETIDLRNVGQIVQKAAALEPTRREAYLREIGASDPALLLATRQRLEAASLLPETFLSIPASELLEDFQSAAVELQQRIPTGLERYQLLEAVGQGGMGQVHRAHDRQLNRPVAIKFLDRLEPTARRRFLSEAQTQARVRHDNVLEVYETGELRGRPFIAMRWVDGPTLAQAAEDLSVEEIVRLLIQVAEGLHAAHREGLIHRDVKPSNVLLEKTGDGAWKAWVADFGIAEPWEKASASGHRFIGTPPYMAPELFADDEVKFDRRIDIYGLGVTLYETLVGEKPFAADSVGILMFRIVHSEYKPLRALRPSLPAELEAIVNKCLEKDPERRYPSARALADDLRRFLEGDVVEAHAATIAYRVTKLALRYRTLIWLGGVSAVALAVALLVAAYLGFEAQKANRRADIRRSQAEDLIGFMLDDLRHRLEPLGKLEILQGVDERAMKYFAAVPQSELSDAELARRSQALYQIGDVHIRRGDLQGALEPLQESLSLAESLAARAPNDGERLFGLGQSHFWVGRVFWDRGQLDDAQRHFEAYLEVAEKLVALDSEKLEWQLELSYAHNNMGFVQRERGDLEAALKRYNLGLAIQERLVKARPTQLDWQVDLANTRDTLGVLAQRLGELDQAVEHFRAEVALRERLVAAEPDNYRYKEFLGTGLDQLGYLDQQRGRLDDADRHLGRASEIYEALVIHDPSNRRWRSKLAFNLSKTGWQAWRTDRPEAARRIWNRMLRLTEDLVAADPGNFPMKSLHGRAMSRMAFVDLKNGRSEEAAIWMGKAAVLLETLSQEKPNDRDIHYFLAANRLLAGDLAASRGAKAEAELLWRRVLLATERWATSKDHNFVRIRALAFERLGSSQDSAALYAELDRQGVVEPEMVGRS